MFRGEPAITRLDWNFTTSHISSAGVSTNVGSDLHRVSPLLHPGHGKIAGFRVQTHALCALFGLAFATAPGLPLNLARVH